MYHVQIYDEKEAIAHLQSAAYTQQDGCGERYYYYVIYIYLSIDTHP